MSAASALTHPELPAAPGSDPHPSTPGNFTAGRRRPRALRPTAAEPPLDDDDATTAAVVLPLPVRLTTHPGSTPRDRRPSTPTALPANAPVPRPDKRTGPRSLMDGDLSQLFGPARTPRAALPDPRPRAAAAVRILLEVLCGDRPTRQVAALVSPAILERLERRPPRRFRAEPRRCELRSLHLSEPAECVAEAAAVVFVPPTNRGPARARSRAVALRLEGADGRWTVTAFTLG